MTPGYRVNKQVLYSGRRTLVLTAIRETDGSEVVIKFLRTPHPTPEEILRFKQEYFLMQQLDDFYIIKAYSFEKYGNSYAIIMENFGAISLEEYLDTEKNLSLDLFFHLAIEITKAISAIHKKQIIHKDINPGNILFNPMTREIKIIDFGLSVLLTKEKGSLDNPDILEGTLPYLSPEQTGRMNRGVDYRSDYYSLGITLYRILTGILPFFSKDSMEIIYSHIAIKPTPPSTVNPSICEGISQLVMKLLEKIAENRYQSTFGLLEDLKYCRDQYKEVGNVAAFPLGKKDLFHHFQIPEKLYGRSAELEKIFNIYNKVLKGSVEILFIHGSPGIGKSSLINLTHRPVIENHGYFVSGKFEQVRRNIPYYALNKAFNELINQLLSESEETLAHFKKKILKAVGTNGKVIIDVIPNLVAIIGPQLAVPELGPAENLNRFTYVFQNFIRSLADLNHPLVIFLDDLQWADLASLKMLEFLLTSPGTSYLFFIGAYRSSEVSEDHPLCLTIEELKKQKIACQSVSLLPLQIAPINEMLSDTLHRSESSVQELSSLLLQKTQGNPFFIVQMLQTLYKEEALFFDSKRNEFCWDISKIAKKDISTNVIEFMVEKISKLSKETKEMLIFAACIGSSFPLDLLSEISSRNIEEAVNALHAAQQEGLIFSKTLAHYKIAYRFVHDRVQQAVYSLIPHEEKTKIHLSIARVLNKLFLKENQTDIFDVVNQYNLVIDYHLDALDDEEKKLVAQLNLQAAKIAKASAAFEPAYKCIEHGLLCLNDSDWDSHYFLTVELFAEAVDTAYLSANFEAVERFSNLALSKAKTLTDEFRITHSMMLSKIAQLKHLEAIEIAAKLLIRLGIILPKNPSQLNILTAVLKVKWALYQRSDVELLNLPEMTDANKRAILSLLMTTYSAAYIAQPNLFVLITCKNILLMLKNGNTEGASFTYSTYGLVSCGALGDIEGGYKFGNLALKLLDKMHDEKFRTKVCFVTYALIKHWKEPIQEVILKLGENFEHGLDNGSNEFACYSIYAYTYASYCSGASLRELIEKSAIYKLRVQKVKQNQTYNFITIFHQAFLNLAEKVENQHILEGKAFDEKHQLQELIQANDKTALFSVYINKLILAFLFYRYDEALIYASQAYLCLDGVMSSYLISTFYFYESLALASFYPKAESRQKKRAIYKKIKSHLKKLKIWAKHCPHNHQPKFLLISAEFAKILGDKEKASLLYDEAIEAARKSKFLNEEAIANELAGNFYLSQNKIKIANIYLHDAFHCFLEWGATAKTVSMQELNPWLTRKTKEGETFPRTIQNTSTVTHTMASTVLDISSIQKSAQAILGTIVLSELLEKLIRIVAENAGAQRSFLLLSKDDKFYIEAEWLSDINSMKILQSIEVNSTTLPLTLINYVFRSNQVIILENASQNGRFIADSYIIKNQTKSILCIPLLKQSNFIGILYLENNLTIGAFTEDHVSILNLLTSQIAISIENARNYSKTLELNQELASLNKAYERFVPRDFLKHLGKKSIMQTGLGEYVEKKMTVMFSDIRNFATISEKMTPKENFDFLNNYLNVVGPVIRKHHGFIDKYIGDAIMALYPGDPDNALQCAIEMLNLLKTFNEKQEKLGKPLIKIGIGINTGSLILGTIGETDRMEGTVISDAVNVASRIESLTKQYATPILISESTYDQLKNPNIYKIEVIDSNVFVKGRNKSIIVYKVENRKAA